MKKSLRLPFQDIPHRITGISTPVFGVSWNPSEDKREIVRRLVVFLEDRRVLYAKYDMEDFRWVTSSVLEMRAELTRTLEACPEKERLTGPIRAMRAACRKFLDQLGPANGTTRMAYARMETMWEALGELRGAFGLHLARLCVAFGIDVEPELAGIFPAADEE